MLKSLHIDGFRSLLNCSIEIRPGINILVGPNGSGKTNIVMFLEFMARMFDRPIAETVNEFGGVGQVFSRFGQGMIGTSIQARLVGGGTISASVNNGGRAISYFEYDYAYSAVFLKKIEAVHFGKQTFKIRKSATRKQLSSMRRSDTWDLYLSQKASIQENHVDHEYRIKKMNTGKFDRIDIPFSGNAADGMRGEIVRHLEQSHDPEFPILLACRFLSPEISMTIDDLSAGKVINIIPHIAKRSEDSAAPPGIGRDGGGLAATLHAVKRNDASLEIENREESSRANHSSGDVGNVPRYRGISKRVNRKHDLHLDINTSLHIEAALNFLEDGIDDLRVEIDPLTNLLNVSVTIPSGDGRARVPLRLLSDGAVKWLAIVTALYTNRSVLVIEEVENFLHPLLQKEFLKIIREIFDDPYEMEGRSGFIILTTHSESLLNSADPSEIIVVTNNSGETKTRRPRRVKQIADTIYQTGVRLGSMYVSGVLEDA